MSLFTDMIGDMIEKIDCEIKERGVRTFGELDPDLQKKFNNNLSPKATSKEGLVDIKRRLLNSLTGRELMHYFNAKFHEVTIPEKFLSAKEKLIRILLEDL